ncbi:MAG: pyrroline-5-carboxylate reductase [Nitrososphaerota archaeon]|jgi:pyrroline-5-carboxylate reductase|nr:pyrroline-5-carboxylate reductase [Nitrososphaerota archaeon]
MVKKMLDDKVAVIGAGMMGSAIIKSLLKGGYKGQIFAVDVQLEKLLELEKLGVNTGADVLKAVKCADIVFIIVKPRDVKSVLCEIRDAVRGKLVVSVAATVPLEYLCRHVPDAKVVRIMPNLGAMVQAAYTAYCCDGNVTLEEKQKIQALLSMMGTYDEVDEKYMDALTAVSGSGPGYMSIIIEALTYAGLKVGLPRDVALKSAAQTVLGTAKLVLDLNEEPARIRDMTTTPGGTTIEAIYQVEQSQIRPALIRAIEEATKKSGQIREKLDLT